MLINLFNKYFIYFIYCTYIISNEHVRKKGRYKEISQCVKFHVGSSNNLFDVPFVENSTLTFSMEEYPVTSNSHVITTANRAAGQNHLNSSNSGYYEYNLETSDFHFENLYDVLIIGHESIQSLGTCDFHFENLYDVPIMDDQLITTVISSRIREGKLYVQGICITLMIVRSWYTLFVQLPKQFLAQILFMNL